MEIIVVDDEFEALNTFLYSIVDRSEIHCQMFNQDPLAAIPYCKNKHVDAAFLDIKMPVIDGISLAKRLIEVSPDIKIFFITSYTLEKEKIEQEIGFNFHGFCHKPYEKATIEKELASLKEEHALPFIKTFGGFDVFVDGMPIEFKSQKAKELLAYAVNKNGLECSIEEAATALWPDKSLDLGKISYRDAAWKLRHSLEDNGIARLIEFHRGGFRIKVDEATCDSWDLLNGKSEIISIPSYLPSYEWAQDNEAVLMDILEKNMASAIKKI